MFLLRSTFWLTTLLVLLPPAEHGGQAPRVNLLEAVYAARDIIQDITGVCERNPAACATSRAAAQAMTRKLETGANIVSASIAAGERWSRSEGDHGTLNPSDMEPAWWVPNASR